MVGLGKHIQGPDLVDGIAAVAQGFQVPGQGFRVAGHIDQPGRGQVDDTGQGGRLAAGPGRVKNYRIRRFGQVGQYILGFAEQKLDIVQASGVLPGIGHGGRGFLNGVHFFGIGGQQDGKSADAGIGVEQSFRPLQVQGRPHRGNQLGGLLGVDLKEGGRGYLKRAAGNRFPIAFLAGGKGYGGVFQRRLHQIITGFPAGPDSQLGSFAAMVLQLGQ